MKKLAIAFLFLGLVFSSCKKYVDGPKISLRTHTQRLTGNWTIEAATYNGNDIMSLFKTSEKMVFLHSKRWGYDGDYGTWSLGEDGDDVTLTSDFSGTQPKAYRILRLMNTSLWLKYTDPSGNITETHWKQ